ncbi:MAG: thioredoxin fold domain-containing protein [Rhodobacteraceae bacterium]|nr:thioredoxin fold domain-containing protein [Paracoccaceae bacterium]
MISRRILMATAFLAALVLPAQAQEISDDGLHIQPWFYDGFLEMGADLEDAASEGKGLIVIFEQRGCPYCRELHEVNFAIPEIAEYQAENFYTVQLNLWGDRIVTDFDGEELSEKDLAQKWLVNFTPTVIFFAPESVGAASEDVAESFRMPGYFKPFHYGSALEYLMSGAYRDTGFQRFTRARFLRFEEEGKDPSLWD